VNKAAKHLARLRESALAGEVHLDRMSEEEWDPIISAIELVEGWRARHAGPLRATNANLRHYVRPHSAPGGTTVTVTQRLKKFSTILDKLCRHPTMQLSFMEDVGGVRAILPSQSAADEVARRLRRNWKIHRYRDYVRQPKESGYRALHLIVNKQGVKVEVQLRTALQDFWANQVERDSRSLGVDFKSGAGHDAVHAYYVYMSELLTMREVSEVPTEDFMRELVSRYRSATPYLASERQKP
jgi:hypothetical protein